MADMQITSQHNVIQVASLELLIRVPFLPGYRLRCRVESFSCIFLLRSPSAAAALPYTVDASMLSGGKVPESDIMYVILDINLH